MTRYRTVSARAAVAVGLVFALGHGVPAARAQGGRGPQVKVADAKPGDTRLIISNGIRAPFEAVKAQAEQAAGHRFIIEYGASLGLKSTIESGQAFEVAIVTPEVIEDMTKQGKIVAGSRFDVARVPVAIGQRGDAPKSDITTPAALKRTLLHAKGIRFAYIGASRPTVDKMFKELAIGEAIKDKIIMDGPGSPGPRREVTLGPGEYELIINLASEVLPVKTQVYLGNIPNEFQIPAVMAAGIGAGGDQETAKALIKFLQGPAIEPFLKENGMQR
jgi:molybdate transport system substrate-binding protein